jgi:hypothetical protein
MGEHEGGSARTKSGCESIVKSGAMSIKFTGLRLHEPSDKLPDCTPFSAESLDPSVYGGFSQLECSSEERSLCDELLQEISAECGRKDPITLLRYLRARQLKVPAAAKMWRNTQEWRASNKLAAAFETFAIDDTLHRRFDPSWKALGLLGRDLEGAPIIWERMGQVDLSTVEQIPVKFLVQHEIYTLVRVQQALDEVMRLEGRPHMYWTVIEDMKGLGWQHFNLGALAKFKETVRIGQDYFPDVVKRIVVIRAPRVFSLIWNIVQHFLDEGTRDKVQIVSEKDTLKMLTRYIDRKWIPQELGGDCSIKSNPGCEPLLTKAGSVPPDLVSEIRSRFGR